MKPYKQDQRIETILSRLLIQNQSPPNTLDASTMCRNDYKYSLYQQHFDEAEDDWKIMSKLISDLVKLLLLDKLNSIIKGHLLPRANQYSFNIVIFLSCSFYHSLYYFAIPHLLCGSFLRMWKCPESKNYDLRTINAR